MEKQLHGIILAETYGVPTVFYQERPLQYNFKYADWYESTGRKEMCTTSDLQEAISMEVDYVPDLSQMQKGLIEAFPYDLWNVSP